VPDPAIVVEDLTRIYPQPKGPPVVAVEDASFQVRAGEVLGLLGPNGAGKTSTLQVLATLARPTTGRALVCGHDVVTASVEVRRNLGYLSSTSGLPTRLTCRECLLLFARLQGVADPQAAVASAIARFGVADYAERHVEGLSTGMRQRLRIACAAVHRPPVLLLDEPTAGLDVVAAHDLLDEIGRLRDDGAAVLFCTHVMQEAERLCDRVAILFDGVIRVVDTPAALMEQTGAANLEDAFLGFVRG
jgi:sodium transport system ATP-binding protein